MSTVFNRITVAALERCHELDPTVAMPAVVPVEERGYPLTGQVFGGKIFARVKQAGISPS